MIMGYSAIVTTGGEVWEWLQGEKEAVSRKLLAEGSLCQNDAGGLRENEVSAVIVSEIKWQNRGQLEARLRDINDAQDRLIDGDYGKCPDCGQQIDPRRLAANPAASLCFDCQNIADGKQRFCTL